MAARGVSMYTPENIGKVAHVLRRCGEAKAACEAVGISPQTYYNWRKRHEEFRILTDDAIHYFKNISIRDEDDIIQEVFRALLERLSGKTTVTTTTIDQTIDPQTIDPETGKQMVTAIRRRVTQQQVLPTETLLIQFIPALLHVLKNKGIDPAVVAQASGITEVADDAQAREALIQVMDALEKEAEISGLAFLMKETPSDTE